MKLEKRIEFEQHKSISSMSEHSEQFVSIGFDDGMVSILNKDSLTLKAEINTDNKFSIVDHCWYRSNTLCVTSGRSVTLFDVEKQKPSGSLTGHLDVDSAEPSTCCASSGTGRTASW
jgi:hypothetical protein